MLEPEYTFGKESLETFTTEQIKQKGITLWLQ